MKSRTPVRATSSAAYPTLHDFSQDRRRFLGRMALGTLAVGFGAVGCYDEQPLEKRFQEQPDTYQGPDANSEPDTYVAPDGITPDSDVSPDTGVYEEELPWAGGMMEPEFYQVRLPDVGSAQVYLAQEGYLSFAVTVLTYDYSVSDALQQDPGGALQAAATALAPFTCEDMVQPVSAAVIAALRGALQDFVVTKLGYGYIESAELVVDYCDNLMMIDGDMAEPQYP